MPRILRYRPRLAAAVLTALATSGLALAQQAAQVAGTLDGHTDPVYAIAWSPDDKTLITGGFDNTVRLWDAATRTEIRKFGGHANLVLAAASAPDGKRILSGRLDMTAKVGETSAKGALKDLTGAPAGVHGLAVRPAGKQAAAASAKTVKIWDLGA